MLAVSLLKWRLDIRNLPKFVPAVCGTTKFVKRLTKKAWPNTVPEKKPMEVLTRGSGRFRLIFSF